MDDQAQDDDADLKLVKASAALLLEFEQGLEKVLWKPGATREVHTRVKQRGLIHLLSLIEPFQGEPYLIDAKLKLFVPELIDAYKHTLSKGQNQDVGNHIPLETAICTLLYTLCKIRGFKIIVGFFNNEPKYLEPILLRLEGIVKDEALSKTDWRVSYILLLWLSHLLLTPFDLSSISADVIITGLPTAFTDLSPVVSRILRVGLAFRDVSNKAQEASAAILVRLCKRPDVIQTLLAERLVADNLDRLRASLTDSASSTYTTIGSLRLLAGIAAADELSSSIPSIFRSALQMAQESVLGQNIADAVTKKLFIKIFRNIVVLSVRAAPSNESLLNFLQTSSALEETIDYLLQSLSDKDTPVRYAAAKALSIIILTLEPTLGHEIIQAVLDMFEIPLTTTPTTIDYTITNPLKWHGLVLTTAHIVFKRSASPTQLPSILHHLLLALQFRQRTATGSTLGTNIRDAANFGIWAVSRRYTTAELLSVPSTTLSHSSPLTLHPTKNSSPNSAIQVLATALIQSATLDPAGNVRRGSSAALQELVGRHPDCVRAGIPLVQAVDYQAVGLRRRAMVEVVGKCAALDEGYAEALLEGLIGWRGVGDAEVAAREFAAIGVAGLVAGLEEGRRGSAVEGVLIDGLRQVEGSDVEALHGWCLAVAETLAELGKRFGTQVTLAWDVWEVIMKGGLRGAFDGFGGRMLKAELPAAVARLITVACEQCTDGRHGSALMPFWADFGMVKEIVHLLLGRSEEWILATVADFVRALMDMQNHYNVDTAGLDITQLVPKAVAAERQSVLHNAGYALAVGRLVVLAASEESVAYSEGEEELQTAVRALSALVTSRHVDWRTIGIKALDIIVYHWEGSSMPDYINEAICNSLHLGMNDYTIDERGDVGSLVRLQAVLCTMEVLTNEAMQARDDLVQVLKADIYRLSLEKLDRVRLQAAICRKVWDEQASVVDDITDVSSYQYFQAALSPLTNGSAAWVMIAVVQGCLSCAGSGAEALLEASRQALCHVLHQTTPDNLELILTIYCQVMKALPAEHPNTTAALELLAGLLDLQIPQRLADSITLKWRTLLSLVQKSHFKSTDILRITAAVSVYRGLADIYSIRQEVLKKLVSMLKTNPYPRVRLQVAEVVWMVTGDDDLKMPNWARPSSDNSEVIAGLQARYVAVAP